MARTWQRPGVAITGWAIAAAAGAGAFALNVANMNGNAGLTAPIGHDAPFTIWGLAYASVGGLVAARRPGNAIGWLLLASGLMFTASSLAYEYANHAIGEGGPASHLALWVAETPSVLPLAMVPLALLLFPDGRLPGPRWRPAAGLAIAAAAFLVLGIGLAPGRMDGAVAAENPFGIAGAETPTLVLQIIGWALTAVGFAVAGRATVVRLRTSDAAVRQQLKWVAYAAALLGVSWMQGTAAYLGPMNDQRVAAFEIVVLTAALAGVPVAMGIAILRHRLFDIDLIIRRTLVYTLLVAALTGVYLTGVVGLSAALREVAGGTGTIVVTISTLAVAATFHPLRKRIQRAVDHRFSRAKYDASATIDRFADRLRDQIDLAALNAELLKTVQATMSPAHASVWIRPPESG